MKTVDFCWGSVAILSGLTLVGHFFDYPLLASGSSEWVTMKLVTAVSFLMTAIAGLCRKHLHLTFALGLTTLMLLTAHMGGFIAGGNVSIIEAADMPYTVAAGVPSWATVFVLGAASILRIGHLKAPTLLSLILCALGGLAIFGYVIDSPTLYFFVPAISTAMALTTAIATTLTGTAMYVESQN